VGMAVQSEISRLEKQADKLLTGREKEWLDELLDKREDFLYSLRAKKRP